MKTLPLYAADLVAELDKMFPARCIGATEGATEAHRYAGKRELVEFLLQVSKKTDANVFSRES